jgi:hypothetical protein
MSSATARNAALMAKYHGISCGSSDLSQEINRYKGGKTP